jgi:outer membrane protein TolC
VTLDLAKKQYQTGYASYVALLNAEQSYQEALINLVPPQANGYADSAALLQTLGGAWWNRPDIPKN